MVLRAPSRRVGQPYPRHSSADFRVCRWRAQPNAEPFTISGVRSLSIVLAVSSITVALVGGCSSHFSPPAPPSSGPAGSSSPASPTKQADDPLPDPSELLQEASTTANALQSAHLVMSVVGKVAETPVKELEADVTNDNASAAEGGAPEPTTKAVRPVPPPKTVSPARSRAIPRPRATARSRSWALTLSFNSWS